MSNETRKCECGGTMHHSNDMNDPFPGEGEGRPFFQCEMCGETVDDGPATETTDRLVHGRLYITDRGKLADIYVLAKNAAEAPITIATDVRIARAWQIVRAVNSHDALVEACKRATQELEDFLAAIRDMGLQDRFEDDRTNMMRNGDDAAEAARDALALARLREAGNKREGE